MKKKIALVLLLLIIIFSLFTFRVFSSAKKAIVDAKATSAAFKLQDLDGAKTKLKDTKSDLEKTKTALIVFTPIRIIPLIGWYVADAQRGINAGISGVDSAIVFTDAVTPYADVLGLKGKGTFLGGTAQERLSSAIETLSKVAPQIDQVAVGLGKSRTEIDKIQAWRYPDFLPGKPGTKLTSIKNSLDQIDSILSDSRPLLTVLPEIMGQDGEKKYLILFQNDKELRPTGGFITAYAVFRINKGTIVSEGSQDSYTLDNSLTKKVPAPAPVLKYLTGVSTLNLRDSNLSPDYLASMKQFEDLYQYTRDKKQIDGIISLDTEFVLSLMRVLGPIDAYGTKFTTDKVDSCQCAQIIYELERYADQPVAYEKGSRKDILGVLMQQIMDKTFKAPKGQWPNLLATVVDSLRQKHLLLYFHNADAQAAAEKINFAGRVNQYDGDYFYINETNFAGAKSNLYIQEKVTQTLKKNSGVVTKNVTIDYKYPKEGDNCSLERKSGLCLAGLYRDWIRIYVPKGSKLTKSSGLEVALTASEDLDKTVFDGFLTVRPQGTAKVEFEYTIPTKVDNQYKLLIQKQPGTDGHTYEINAFGKHQKAFPLDTDKQLVVKL